MSKQHLLYEHNLLFYQNTSVKHYSFHENTKKFLQTPYKQHLLYEHNLVFLPNTSVKHYSFHENTKKFYRHLIKLVVFFIKPM